MRIGEHLIAPATVLAPMASITNPPFRQICLELGVGLTACEVLSATQLLIEDAPVPFERAQGEMVLVVQIYGRVPQEVAKAARVAEEHGADVIDINMGCPARKIVKQGAGVALMREPELARMITDAVVSAVDVPVTVKMRTGFSSSDQNALAVARAVVSAGACAVTIHARVREAVHTGPVDWEIIRRVRDGLQPEITVVGNGGIKTLDDADRMVRETGCDGVMVGRGARGNPWIFSALASGSPHTPSLEERHDVILRHLDCYVRWGGEDRAVLEMRKHLCWYFRGMPGASALRKALSGLKTEGDVVELVKELVTPSRPRAGQREAT